MDLDTFMITVFCCIDDILESLYQGRPLRQRGPKPALCDAEVLTMEVVGEYLGLSQDQALFRYCIMATSSPGWYRYIGPPSYAKRLTSGRSKSKYIAKSS